MSIFSERNEHTARVDRTLLLPITFESDFVRKVNKAF